MVENFPETVVAIFSHQLFRAILDFLGGNQIAESHDVDGIWPVYEVTYKGKRFFYRPYYKEVIVVNPDGIKDANSSSDINIRVDNYSLVIEKSDNNKPLKLSLYNIKGIMVKGMVLSDEITQISLSEFPQSGVYIYHISGDKINKSGMFFIPEL